MPKLLEGDSYFTALDNINLPIAYLKKEIIKLNKSLSEEVPKMQQIRSDMKEIEKSELKKIE